MMDKNRVRTGNRTTVVTDIRVKHTKLGDSFHPKNKPGDQWTVWVELKTGLLPPALICNIFDDEAEMLRVTRAFKVGDRIPDTFEHSSEKSLLRADIENRIDARAVFGPANIGDSETTLAYNTLEQAGVLTGYEISQEVVDYLGDARLQALKEIFEENWSIAAIYEYCWLELPHSSPAFVAASYKFHWYISEDDFAAGYYWRDLEVLANRVEETAAQVIATRQKAGQSGSKKSAQAREKRRADLFERIAALVERNPDLARVGAESVARLACEECARDNESLWTQGRGQVSDYLGEIRRGEAGPDMQKRFQAIFGSKPPKQFRGKKLTAKAIDRLFLSA